MVLDENEMEEKKEIRDTYFIKFDISISIFKSFLKKS